MNGMKKNLLTVFFTSLFFIMPASRLTGQDTGKSSGFSFGADVVSRYIWRGLNLGGSAAHIQPDMSYSLGKTGLSLEAWASHAIGSSRTGTEVDLILSYTPVSILTFAVTDYYFPIDTAGARGDFLNFKKGETRHVFEGSITFNGSENIPVYAIFAINFYGADGTDSNGDPYYAKYAEIGYTHAFSDADMKVFMGAALDNPRTSKGWYGYYGPSGGIVNLGLTLAKKIKITDSYSLPVNSSLIVNPESQNIYIVFGLTF